MMILRRRVKRRLLIIGVVLLLGTISATGAYALPVLKNIVFVVLSLF